MDRDLASSPVQIVGHTLNEPFLRRVYIYISLELEVAQARLSDLRALDTLRGNKCASLRFHGERYIVPATAAFSFPLYTIVARSQARPTKFASDLEFYPPCISSS